VGNTIADGESVQLSDDFPVQFARGALINSGRIKKTVGNHALAAFQRRFDHFPNELAATRFKKKQLSFRGYPHALRRELQQFADRFANRSSTLLASGQKGNSQYLETRGPQLPRGPLSRTLRPFEGC